MKNEMYAWYIDNRFYISKEFVDGFLGAVSSFQKSHKGNQEITYKDFFAADKNAASRATFARNIGLIDANDNIGDSAKLYMNGFLSYSELVLELIFKRNTTKESKYSLKPLVILCKVFNLMLEEGIEETSHFITTAECYEYLSPVESYDEITVELVKRIVNERKYKSDNTNVPIPRFKSSDIKGSVYLSSLFSALNDTPLFEFGEQKSVLSYDNEAKNFIRFIAEKGQDISDAPSADGSQKKNAEYYNYLCDIDKGLFEIIPKLDIKNNCEFDDAKGIYEYLFGIEKSSALEWQQYFNTDCFGVFSDFISFRRLIATAIYLQDNTLGELLYDYINQCLEGKEEEGKMMRMPFADTEHTLFESEGLQYEDIFKHNLYGIHIKKENDALSKERPHICIGWSGMGDLSGFDIKEDINNRHADIYPDATPNSRGQDVGQIHRFKNEAKTGDYVVFAEQTVCHIGRITSEYYYDTFKYPNQSEDYVNVRNIEWLKTNIKRTELSAAFHNSLGAGMSFWGLNDYKSAVYELLNGTYVKDIIELPEDDDMAVVDENENENYTIEELGNILTQMYKTAENKTTAIHMFGLKYGEIIIRNGYSANKLVGASKIPDSYHVEVNKGTAIYKSIRDNEYGIHFVNEESVSEIVEKAKELPILPKRTRKTFELNNILYGAPGTGKTYATAKYALAIVEGKALEEFSAVPREEIMRKYNQLIKDERVVFTTFHQNYGYEDFIQGIRPDTTTAEMHFKTVDGVFKQIVEKAMDTPEKDFVIIIDEINRANISKVFGELITLIEDDKRWGEENAVSATLPSGEIFAVPNNLYIVGTMNSADKSISLIDTALRRRFEFVEFVPDLSLISDANLKKVLEKLNDGISKELNSTDLLVGHSYFINKKLDDICTIMNRSIIPLLYEYFFDNKNKVEAQLKSALEDLDVEIVSNTMGRIKIKKKEV